MRAHEILGYVDLDRISTDLLRQLQNMFNRELKRPVDLIALGLQYGHEAADLEVEQAKAELAKTRAETERLQAAVAKDRAESLTGNSVSAAQMAAIEATDCRFPRCGYRHQRFCRDQGRTSRASCTDYQ